MDKRNLQKLSQVWSKIFLGGGATNCLCLLGGAMFLPTNKEGESLGNIFRGVQGFAAFNCHFEEAPFGCFYTFLCLGKTSNVILC